MKREPLGARLLQDVLRLTFLGCLLGAMHVGASLPPAASSPLLDVVQRIVAALAGELVALTLIRGLLPRPKVGWFRTTFNAAYVRFLMSASFNQVAWHPLVRGPFWFLHSTRVLYLKALGARVAWTASFHEALVVRDPSLVRIGAGAQLEPGVTLEAALHGAGRVRVGEVMVGPGCLLGAHTLLMPGATLGHEARIEPATVLGEDARVGVGSTIGEGARLERGVDVGSYATVGTGAILGQGVRLGDRARVTSGALVEPDTVVPEREVWSGVPARPAPRIADEDTARLPSSTSRALS